jgi:hypothetical protein
LTQTSATRLLLGPQRPVSSLGQSVARLALPDGPLACISAGWQEAEGDIDDVRELAGRPLHDLELYQRAEVVQQAHADLRDAYGQRQERLKEQQRLYALRLRHLMIAARDVMRAAGEPNIVAAERRHAIAQLRALDRHHVQRVQTIHDEFDARFGVAHYAPLAEHRTAIEKILDECQALVITGGNVIILLNRMLLFGLGPLLKNRCVIAWSAGAMVLSDQIVLFHDRLPEGRRDAEVLGAGLRLVPRHIILPDANHRVRSKDTVRLSLFCHRFSPYTPAMLNPGSLLRFDDGALTGAEDVRRIKRNGSIGIVHAT